MKHVHLPPNAPVLLESMRAVGYDVASAIADILDNSVTAAAKTVRIRFDPGQPRSIAIVDDGVGMSREELVDAMRHGSRNPNDQRTLADLGRFGLGLKTASMSQCRRLTVLSKQGASVAGMMWDLDDVAKSMDWTVLELDSRDRGKVPHFDLLMSQASGTLVLWEKLDRLAAEDPGDGSVLSKRMAVVSEHLALVFHRFLDSRPALRIEINEEPIRPVDPFLEEEGSLAGPEEAIWVGSQQVLLRSFTLPHISRLTRAQIERAGGEAGLRRHQGFYVYRARRLIIWGTWFRLRRQEELTKLTRIRVDVPNALDHLWSLDIKKSTASPPAAIAERLRGLANAMVRPSRKAHDYRGRVSGDGGVQRLWVRVEARDGIRYELNTDHVVIRSLREQLDESAQVALAGAMRAISDALPIEALYHDRANDLIGHKQIPSETVELEDRLEVLARQILAAFSDKPDQQRALIGNLQSIEPFSLYPELTTKLQKRLAR